MVMRLVNKMVIKLVNQSVVIGVKEERRMRSLIITVHHSMRVNQSRSKLIDEVLFDGADGDIVVWWWKCCDAVVVISWCGGGEVVMRW